MALIDLEKAAEILGVTTDELIEMRDRNEIHGYRDGSSWKFKEEEVQRVKEERGSGGDDDSILVSEQELGGSTGSTSTIIGRNDAAAAADSDIQLSGGSGSAAGSDEMLGGDDVDSELTLGGSATGSELVLEPETGSELELGGSSDTGSGSDLSLGSASGTGDLDLASDLSLGSDDLDLGEDDLALGEDDDDDLVLGGSGNLESDITLGSADTGINLMSPSDSGLSLEEEPLDLGSSVSSLELPEDEEGLEELGGAEAGVPQDDEFMLSGPGLEEDADDSGSQVIALEDSAAFTSPDAATMLGGADQQLPEDPAAMGAAGGGIADIGAPVPGGLTPDMTPAPTPGMPGMQQDALATGGMPMPAAPTVTEAPYSLLSVLGLLLVAGTMALGGLMMVDVIRNMWAWNENLDVATGMADGIVEALGLKK